MGGSRVQPKSKFKQKQNIYDTPLLRVGGWVGLGPFFKTKKEKLFGTASIRIQIGTHSETDREANRETE